MSETREFTTGYMDNALRDLTGVVGKAANDLRGVNFDTIVGTGFSGGIVIPMLATMMNKKFVLIRKDSDDSHHGQGRPVGVLGRRWIFVDDFISSGTTLRRVQEKTEQGCGPMWMNGDYYTFDTTYVGVYLYGEYVAENTRFRIKGKEFDQW